MEVCYRSRRREPPREEMEESERPIKFCGFEEICERMEADNGLLIGSSPFRKLFTNSYSEGRQIRWVENGVNLYPSD